MSSFSSNAVLAKARSMYAHALTPSDYEELLKRRSVSDVVSYLKSETSYGDIFDDLKEVNIHRGQLESLLNEEAFMRTSRLIHYAPKNDMKFYRLGIIRQEINLILTKVRLLDNNESANYEIDIPSYLVKYATFDLYGLLSINDYQALLAHLAKTPYYHVLVNYAPKDEDDKVDTNMMELDFKHIYFKEYVDTIKTLFKGQKQKDLLTMLYTQIELQNISKIYRLKKFFNATPEQIKESLILEYSRIPRSTMEDLIQASDAEEFLHKLSESPYKLYADDKEFVYIEYYAQKIRYHLAKRFMRFSTDAALVYMTYVIVHSIEIDNLKHIIEGLRYGEAPDAIDQMLIY